MNALRKRDKIAMELGFERGTERVWWGPCVACGAPKASLGVEGYSCTTCGLSQAFDAIHPFPDDAPQLRPSECPDRLPTEALPPALRRHVESVSANLQVPSDLPLMLGLAAVSAPLAGRVVTSVRPGWAEQIGIFTVCILSPATRKSAAYAAMTSPLKDWEAEAIARAAPKVAAARDEIDVLEESLRRAKAAAASGKGSREEVEALRIDLERARTGVPVDGRLLAGDITTEAMVQRLVAQGGRLAILEPEPGPLSVLDGRYSDHARLDEVKKAWSGETITVDRVGRSPQRVEHPALTLALCIQPGVLEALSNRGAFRREGVFGRILWCRPPDSLGARLTGEAVPAPDRAAASEYSLLLRSLAEGGSEATQGVDRNPHILSLTAGALDHLYQYEAEVEGELADGARCASIRDWAGKCVGQAVRLATLIELADRAGKRASLIGAPIGHDAMGGGIELARALTTHALAVLAPIAPEAQLRNYLMRRILELPTPSTLRDLFERTKGRRDIDSMDDIRRLVGDLEDAGCVRLWRRPPGRGRPPSPVIELNPSLAPADRKSREMREGYSQTVTSANNANSRTSFPSAVEDPLAVLAEVYQ